MRWSIKIKILAVVLTAVSAIILTSISPRFNESVLVVRYGQKYSKLDQAIEELSDFRYKNKQNQSISAIYPTNPGFYKMLEVIQKRTIVTSEKTSIDAIFILKTGTGIKIGDFWANPDYLLGVAVDDNYEYLAVLYGNQLESWIEEEKRDDLQTFSFFMVVIAILADLLSDVPQNDFLELKEKINRSITSGHKYLRNQVKQLRPQKEQDVDE